MAVLVAVSGSDGSFGGSFKLGWQFCYTLQFGFETAIKTAMATPS